MKRVVYATVGIEGLIELGLYTQVYVDVRRKQQLLGHGGLGSLSHRKSSRTGHTA